MTTFQWKRVGNELRNNKKIQIKKNKEKTMGKKAVVKGNSKKK